MALMRAGARGPEIFLVKRHAAASVMAGAYVPPGGRVEPADSLADVAAHCDGLEGVADRLDGLSSDDARGFHVAAIRELFEEAGVLLARNPRGNAVGARESELRRMEVQRVALCAGRPLAEILAEEGWRLALDWLAPFAHWVTPEIDVRRFDTRFFLALVPETQDASHDGQETTLGAWLRPSDAIALSAAGAIALPPPTWTTLRQLERFAAVDDAVAWARSCPVPRVQPGFILRDSTRIVTLPGDPNSPAVPGFDATERRFVFEAGRWRPIDPD